MGIYQTGYARSRDDNVFFHFSALESPGADLQKGDVVEFAVEHARDGRARATNVRLVEPERQRYPTRHLTAEEPSEPRPYVQRDGSRVYVEEPAALERDRERVRRDYRTSHANWRRAEKLFVHHGRR
jgi:cold shock CspA family protein